MEPIKYWSLDCTLLNETDFDHLISNLEQFIKERKESSKLPQQQSQEWLSHFIQEYSN